MIEHMCRQLALSHWYSEKKLTAAGLEQLRQAKLLDALKQVAAAQTRLLKRLDPTSSAPTHFTDINPYLTLTCSFASLTKTEFLLSREI